jgi:hypothetical protein
MTSSTAYSDSSVDVGDTTDKLIRKVGSWNIEGPEGKVTATPRSDAQIQLTDTPVPSFSTGDLFAYLRRRGLEIKPQTPGDTRALAEWQFQRALLGRDNYIVSTPLADCVRNSTTGVYVDPIAVSVLVDEFMIDSLGFPNLQIYSPLSKADITGACVLPPPLGSRQKAHHLSSPGDYTANLPNPRQQLHLESSDDSAPGNPYGSLDTPAILAGLPPLDPPLGRHNLPANVGSTSAASLHDKQVAANQH